MAEMEEAMEQKQSSQKEDTATDDIQPSDDTPGTEEDITGA